MGLSVPGLLLVVIGAGILSLAAAEEPYHIDELRQTRHYDKSVGRILEESRAQEQPPLDPLLNSVVQKAIGIGDVRQRALSVAFAAGSLVAVLLLTIRGGLTSSGSAVAVAVMALSPPLIVVSAYARPYALPLFLMLLFLLLGDIWLEAGRVWSLVFMVPVALVLPWSRTVEPVIFLGAVVVVSAVIAITDSRRRARILAIAVTAVGGLCSSALSLRFVSQEISDRTTSGDTALMERLGRLLGEVPRTFGEAFPFWPLALVLAVLVVALPAARRLLASLWWWWPLAGTSVGFAIAFAAIAPVGQPFYSRYVFTIVPPVAVLIGVVVSATSDSKRVVRSTTIGLASVVVLVAAIGTWIELTRPSRADWEAVSHVVVRDLPDDFEILYDAVRPLGAYRTTFAGRPRYTDDHGAIPLTTQVVDSPESIDGGRNTAVVLLNRSDFAIDGWTPVGVDSYFTVYLPETPRSGRRGAAVSYQEFGEAMGPELGAAMSLASAALWLDIGEPQLALEVALPLLEDDALASAVAQTLSGTALEEAIESELSRDG